MTSPLAKLSIRPGSWLDLQHVNPHRAFFLMALGGLIGLGMAGVALFQAKGTSTMIVPADAVAVVNQQPISRIDFDMQMRALSLDPATVGPGQRQRMLNDMIREELFVQRGKELDVAMVDPAVRNAMVSAVEAQAAANALTTAPTEKELEAYFQAHRERYASEGVMTARELVFPAASAAAAREALAAGQSPDAVAAGLGGKDSKRVDGEEFYFAAQIHLGDAVFAAAKILSDGEVSQPVTLADGVHLVVMQHNVKPRPYSFEEARDQVYTHRQTEAQDRYQKADEKFLRKRANILIAPDLR